MKHDIRIFFERRGSASNETKYNLLKRHFEANKNYPFPVHATGSKTRKFQVSCMDKYAWLVFSSVKKGVSANSMLCFLVIKPEGGLIKTRADCHGTLGELDKHPRILF